MQPSHIAIAIISESVSCNAFDKDNPFHVSSLSIESHEIPHLDLVNYAQEYRDRFLRLIEFLPPIRRQMIVEYALLRKTEKQIATIHGRKSQSMLGQELKSILKLIAARLAQSERTPTDTRLARTPKLRRRKRVFRDPHWLGQFDVALTNRNVESLFTARAGQVSNAAHI